MIELLPTDARDALDWPWERFAPFYAELAERPLNAITLEDWLADWSQLSALVTEAYARLQVAFHGDTADGALEQRYLRFVAEVAPAAEVAEQRLRERLLACARVPAGMQVPLRGMRAAAELFRAENVPLQAEENQIGTTYDKIVGAQAVEWEGRTLTVPQLREVYADHDRARRERAWWLAHERQLADREQLNQLWRELLALRQEIAANAGQPSYLSYLWQAYGRFDYTPADCERFHAAIEAVAVPAATRIYERLRARLGAASLRPWDLANGEWGPLVEPPGRAPLAPYRGSAELQAKATAVLARVDPQLAAEFAALGQAQLLDLDNRPGKAPGGYCTFFALERRPYIFMNGIGQHNDVQILLHEAGHAFHAVEAARLPFVQQMSPPMEFNEVASMAMELLTAPFLDTPGGFYTPAQAAQARIEQLEQIILFWPYMAVIDAFQHWAYAHPELAADPQRCDQRWHALWDRFMPGVDWSGMEAELVTGWQRRLHVFRAPLYYVEYGLASLGAVQVWRNALADPGAAFERYRAALRLGGTASLPDLYAAAGARFSSDAGTLAEAIGLIERTIDTLERQVEREASVGQ